MTESSEQHQIQSPMSAHSTPTPADELPDLDPFGDDVADYAAPLSDTSSWELMEPAAAFDSLPRCVKLSLQAVDATPGNWDLLSKLLEDITLEEVTQILDDANELSKHDPEDLHARLRSLATLSASARISSRAKRLKTCNYFRVPAMLSGLGTQPSTANFLRKPRVRPHPTMLQLASKRRAENASFREDKDPQSRAAREEEARIRQSRVILGYFAEAKVPAYTDALASLDPDRALAGCLGSTRATSLRKHERAWRRLRFWVKINHGIYLD
jgi:hypothetical protein